jgi:hypothetical protein
MLKAKRERSRSARFGGSPGAALPEILLQVRSVQASETQLNKNFTLADSFLDGLLRVFGDRCIPDETNPARKSLPTKEESMNTRLWLLRFARVGAKVNPLVFPLISLSSQRGTLTVLKAATRIAICSTAITVPTVPTAFAQTQSIPIANAGFQSDVLDCTPGPVCFGGVVPGWVMIGTP